MKTVLTIAGSDSSGGAGIQADIKTISAHRLYAMSVITALTAQNTMGISGILEVPSEFVGRQLDSIFTDIFPDSIKIGMVSGKETIEVIRRKLQYYKGRNIVIDPVMISTSGRKLLQEEDQRILIERLLPLATLLTPNLLEVQVLSGYSIETREEMEGAARAMGDRFPGAILIKGGHLRGEAADLLYQKGKVTWYEAKRVDNPNNHGTGCTLSSAIACGLASGNGLEESVQKGKEYVTQTLKAMLNLGKGSGPLNHFVEI